MVLRLVIDAVRRKWRIAALAVFQLHLVCPLLLRIWPSSEGTAWTMSGAWFLSLVAGDLLASRELYQLPVSRRTWWIARWWLCVLGPVLIAQLAVSLAQWRAGTQWFGVEQAVLSMTFGVLYCGCSMAVRTTSLGRSVDAPATFVSAVVFAPALLLFISAPFVFAPYLPHSFADLHATLVVVMLVMAAFTVVGYRHSPAITARPNMGVARSAVPPIPSSAAPDVEESPPGFIGRLTGAKMVLWEECRKQFTIFATVIAMGVAYWAVASQFRSLPRLGECLRKAAVLPFSSPRALITEPIVFGVLLVVALLAEGWMAAGIRSLRTLPISSTKLSSLPAGLGLVSASMLWIVLLVLHALVLRTPPSSLRPDLFIAFAALTAAAQTIRFAAPGQMVGKTMLGFAPVGITWLTLGYFSDSWRTDLVQPAMLIGGVLTLAASWAVMRLALTRSSAMYQPRAAVGARM